MRFVAIALLLTACATTPAPSTQPAPSAADAPTARELTPPSNKELAEELAAMGTADQEVRQRWIKDQTSEALRSEMRELSAAHVKRLEEIIDSHGWPGLSLVGFNGMSRAWMIAQHGGATFLQKTLPLMYEAVKKGDLDESLYGTSLDRVLVQQGKKQMYGTQFDVDAATGQCAPKPIEDEEHVDERRLRAGMTSLAEYTEQLCAMYLQKK
jgi:hypothetical protein